MGPFLAEQKHNPMHCQIGSLPACMCPTHTTTAIVAAPMATPIVPVPTVLAPMFKHTRASNGCQMSCKLQTKTMDKRGAKEGQTRDSGGTKEGQAKVPNSSDISTKSFGLNQHDFYRLRDFVLCSTYVVYFCVGSAACDGVQQPLELCCIFLYWFGGM